MFLLLTLNKQMLAGFTQISKTAILTDRANQMTDATYEMQHWAEMD